MYRSFDGLNHQSAVSRENLGAHHVILQLWARRDNLGIGRAEGDGGGVDAVLHNLPKWEGVWAVGRLRGARIRMASARTLGGRGSTRGSRGS